MRQFEPYLSIFITKLFWIVSDTNHQYKEQSSFKLHYKIIEQYSYDHQ